MASQNNHIIESVRISAKTIQDDKKSYYYLLDQIGDARFVLLGEDTHGSSEFYRARSEITQLLINEKGFNIIALEADFPEAYRINQFLWDRKNNYSAKWALDNFKRFPSWMWKNKEMLSFIEDLKRMNLKRPETKQISLYGLDLYSMHSSIEAVVAYLEKIDSDAAQRAKKRYACFYQYGSDDDSYSQAMGYVKENCKNEVVAELIELQSKKLMYLSKDGLSENEELFCAEQNAILAKNAEQYYREMFNKRVNTWNLRDLCMSNMVDSITEHVSKIDGSAKAVIWAHNSHTGNALATEFSESGELSLGQLLLFNHWGEAYLIGFTTFNGTVAAASEWGGLVENKRLNPAIQGSYEQIFHETGKKAMLLDFQDFHDNLDFFKKEHFERAVGVVYTPETEMFSHYFKARLADQFDAVIHFDTTNPVSPL